MNAPFRLTPSQLPTTERPEFKAAMEAAKAIGTPNRAKVLAWAAKMKAALR
jgi:hypothetical protein